MAESKYTQFGDELTWGVPKDEMSLVTQTVTFTQKSDKKEVRDMKGKSALSLITTNPRMSPSKAMATLPQALLPA